MRRTCPRREPRNHPRSSGRTPEHPPRSRHRPRGRDPVIVRGLRSPIRASPVGRPRASAVPQDRGRPRSRTDPGLATQNTFVVELIEAKPTVCLLHLSSCLTFARFSVFSLCLLHLPLIFVP